MCRVAPRNTCPREGRRAVRLQMRSHKRSSKQASGSTDWSSSTSQSMKGRGGQSSRLLGTWPPRGPAPAVAACAVHAVPSSCLNGVHRPAAAAAGGRTARGCLVDAADCRAGEPGDERMLHVLVDAAGAAPGLPWAAAMGAGACCCCVPGRALSPWPAARLWVLGGGVQGAHRLAAREGAPLNDVRRAAKEGGLGGLVCRCS